MSYIILKQLLPAIDGNDNFNYIDKCTCIENDEIFSYNTLEEAQEALSQLTTDQRYVGRRLKIIER
jgi:hypothetical protein